MNLQVIASPNGDIVWVSGALPGAVHNLTKAIHVLQTHEIGRWKRLTVTAESQNLIRHIIRHESDYRSQNMAVVLGLVPPRQVAERNNDDIAGRND